ncbi:hypothetical protein Q2T52_04360 [Rhizobium oryzicola]|uniref:Uncharacterized protein n=1 Tax=Rhizobium oryzicola TaxID=1232668 RepID=A0ABT8SSE2_9HYPH|nr:hypothetical protein [Rhizobium oryzicola]
MEEDGNQSATRKSNPTVDSLPSKVMVNLGGKLLELDGYSFKIGYLTVKEVNISALPESEYQDFLAASKALITGKQDGLEHDYTTVIPADVSNDPRVKPYATVTVAGKGIVRIDNQGVVGAENDALGRILTAMFANDTSTLSGPDAAEYRAKKIAQLLGGTIEKAKTAITQKVFESLPPLEDKKIVDTEGMKKDPRYQEIERLQSNYEEVVAKRAQYLAGKGN